MDLPGWSRGDGGEVAPRQRGIAKVFCGTAGFGAHSVLHTAQILRLSQDLPVVIEIVDTEQTVDRRLVPILDEMVAEGLVTIEKVRVLKYGARPG